MKLVVFIDDDDKFEIPLFRKAFSDYFDIVTGTSLDQVCAQLEAAKRIPDLFVLDMYFPDAVPQQADIKNVQTTKLSIDEDQGNIRAAYSNFQRAQNRLKTVLRAWKQGPEGGWLLAENVAAKYPHTPIIFYSRKATAEDVIRCLTLKNVYGVERKVTGLNDEDTERKTLENAGRLAATFTKLIETKGEASIEALRSSANAIEKYLKSVFG
jgi:CheY-like chemotaxis protein